MFKDAPRSTFGDLVRQTIVSRGLDETGVLQLNRDELIAEVIKAKTDKNAMETVLFAVMPYIYKNVRKFSHRTRHLDEDDLCMYAYFGLQRAVEKYDANLTNEEGKPYSFLTYATNWILQALQRNCENFDNTIKIPCHQHKIVGTCYLRYQKYCDENSIPHHERKHFGDLDPAFILSLVTGITPKPSLDSVIHVQDWYNQCLNHGWLDEKIGFDDDGTSIGDFLNAEDYDQTNQYVNPETSVGGAMFDESILDTLRKLPIRVRMIMFFRFGLGGLPEMTLAEAGEQLGITRERIRQIESKTIRIIREWYKGGKMFNLENHSAFSRERERDIPVLVLNGLLNEDQLDSLLNEYERDIFDRVIGLHKEAS